MTIKLSVTPRDGHITAATQQGDIPAVVYGPKQPSTAIAVDKQTFAKLFAEAGESTIISLEGLDEPVEVLVQDVAFDPAKGGIVHVDFYAIERGKELTTSVALEFVGEAPAEKDGIVVKSLHEVEVTCRPSVLPSHLTVDLTALDSVEAQILVSDLPVAEGVTINTDADTVVATISVHKEEPEADTVAPDMDAIEVEAKGKEDTDGEDTE
jgi:large subunit ribosomal protein L25